MAGEPFERGSWQHAVDDQLVGFGRTSQEFATPHEAVRWLLEQTAEVPAGEPFAWAIPYKEVNEPTEPVQYVLDRDKGLGLSRLRDFGAELVGEPIPLRTSSVPAFDATKPCLLTTADPTRTYCERCKNPHHACDRGASGVGASDKPLLERVIEKVHATPINASALDYMLGLVERLIADGKTDLALARLRDARASVAVGVVAAPAHSKSEYKRRVAQGDPSVLPPAGGVPPSPEPSGETMAQREEVCAAWADLPAALTAHPGMKRLYRALGGIRPRDGADGVPRLDEPQQEGGR